MNHNLSIIIVAAGKGTRMKSKMPKVMHKIADKPMITHLVCKAKLLHPKQIIAVIGESMEEVKSEITKSCNDNKEIILDFVIQKERLGTAHAVMQAIPYLNNQTEKTLILYGDTPLIEMDTIKKMLNALSDKKDGKALIVFGFRANDPLEYGRLVIDENNSGKLIKIVEFKEASESERQINLCNSGVISCYNYILNKYLQKIDNNNSKGEYYLTDIVNLVNQDGIYQTSYVEGTEEEALGINSRMELATANKFFQNKLRKKFMDLGVTLIDPDSVFFSNDTVIENDVIIHPSVIFLGRNFIEEGVEIKSFSHIEDAIIKKDSVIGPFARIRPQSIIGKNSRIGNFVEIKNSNLDNDSKVNHLSYIGDSNVGKNCNIGAGTITCNYDGFDKYKTTIGDGTFVGSNSIIISPVTIGKNTIIGAGSVITEDVSDNQIAIARSKQVNIEDGAIRFREKKKSGKK